MELQTVMKQINAMESVFDDFVEQPVDCDFVLPDYLPDISAILKCILKPIVQNYQISGDRIMVDGNVLLHILYLDEERKCVRSFENAQPFTTSFTVKEMNSNNHVSLGTKVNYVNCRATSPRRVDVHGAFNVTLKVTGEFSHSVVERPHCDDLYVKIKNINYSRQIGCTEKTFTLSEILELENAQNAEILIRTTATPYITDCKLLPGKAIVKGEMVIKTVYAADSVVGTLGCSENTVQFSQIVDLDGLQEECQHSCQITLLYCDAHPTQNPGGENKLLSFTAKLMISFQAFKKETTPVAIDAYHVKYPLKMEKKSMDLCCVTDVIRSMETISLSPELPNDDILSIIDLWCDILHTSTRVEAGVVHTDVQISVCMLARDSRDCLSFYERPAEFTLTHTDSCSGMTVEMDVIRAEYTLVGKELTLQLTLCIERKCAETESCSALCEIAADEKAAYGVDETMADCCMKVYFACRGESVWEIAKAQHVSLEEICEENGCADEVFAQDCMLLLPKK